MDLSIVVPVYNEMESVPRLHDALRRALERQPLTWEALYVDDGSADGSGEALTQLAAGDQEHVQVITFRRNYGQTAALSAGIDHARGEVIVLMDADLQNDPADIPLLLERLDQGWDVVCGWRKERQDRFLTRRVPSVLANRLISAVTGVRLHDYGCTLKAFRREVLAAFRLYGEMHRFIPAYARAAGARITEMPVRHHARRFGKSKYGLGRTMKVLLDLATVRFLTNYAGKPMYLFGRIGAWLALIGVLVAIFPLSANRWLGGHHALFPYLLTGILLILGGVQCVLMGLLAELLIRTYYESQGKRPYLVKHVIGREEARRDTVA